MEEEGGRAPDAILPSSSAGAGAEERKGKRIMEEEQKEEIDIETF